MIKIWTISLCFFLLPLIGAGQTLLLQENFDSANFTSRGWYDSTGDGGAVSTSVHIPGSAGSFECRWVKGGTACAGGLPQRLKITPTDSVYLSFWMKHSSSWTGKGTHIFYLLTTEDGDYSGLARTHLTAYFNEGTVKYFEPDLELQDALNIDETKINVDLTKTTERRATQGCNGLPDVSHSFVSCYSSGTGIHTNMRVWQSGITFTTGPGQYNMQDWHHIEAYYKLNTIDASTGKARADGVLTLWIDAQIRVDRKNVQFRTGAYPKMLFNQLILAPYMGQSAADQTIWIDDLTVATTPKSSTKVPSPPERLTTH